MIQLQKANFPSVKKQFETATTECIMVFAWFMNNDKKELLRYAHDVSDKDKVLENLKKEGCLNVGEDITIDFDGVNVPDSVLSVDSFL